MKLFFSTLLSLFTVVAIESCREAATEVPATTLVVEKQGSVLHAMADTNTYTVRLSCGCPFPIVIEDADTSLITYDVSQFNNTVGSHAIKAFPKKTNLASGSYYGHISVTVTDKMDKDYVFHSTLRDTLVIP